MSCMRKISFFCLLLSIILVLSAKGITVRVFPIAYDSSTKEWVVLLGHNEMESSWSEFGQVFLTAAEKELEDILTLQTGKLYTISDIKNTVILNPSIDEVLYFIEVPYRSLTGFISRSLIKDEFVWISLAELLTAKVITRKHHLASGLSSDDMVAPETLRIIQQYIPAVLLELQGAATSIVPQLLQLSTQLAQLRALV